MKFSSTIWPLDATASADIVRTSARCSRRFRFLASVLAVVLFAGTVDLHSQSVANYGVTRATGITYSSIAGSSPSYFAWRNTSSNQNDDNRSFQAPIGFDFWYLGVRYTQFSASLNGLIDFSSSTSDANSSPYAYGSPWQHQWYSDAGGQGSLLALAPLYADLWTQNYGTVPISSSLYYLTTGTAPNRVLTIEWLHFDGWNSPVNATPADINMQVKIYEATGVIEFVYGTMTTGTSNTGAYYLRYASGINGTALGAPPTAAQLLTQQVANSTTFNNGQQDQLTVLPASNSKLTFTPPVPAAPTGLSFTGVTKTGMTLNWSDNASNEDGYVIYNSTDDVNFTYVTQSAANSTSAAISGLVASTTYYWRVYAVTEGTLSTALTGSQATLAQGTVTSIASGNWSNPLTWDSGVPTAGDNVFIANTHTVVLDMNGACNTLTVGQGASGQLTFGNDATVRTLTVNTDVTVSTGATMTTGATAATHALTLGGNLTNNGTLNLAPTAARVCDVTFNKNGNQTLSGTGATTNLNRITLNMGSSSTNVLEVTSTNFTVVPTSFLTLTNGTFKLSTATAVLTPFTGNVTIPLSSGLWLNNAGATVSTTGGSITLYGTVRATAGTLNIGNASDNSLTSSGGTLIVDGGTVNIAGRLDKVGVNLLTYFTMSSGTLTVATVGSTLAGAAPFRMDEIGSTFNLSGGTIIIRRPGAGNLGYVNTGGTVGSVTGGTLQIGDGSTPAGQTMLITSTIPVYHLVVSNGVAVTAQLSTNPLTVKGNITVNNSGTLNDGGLQITGNAAGTVTLTAGTGLILGSAAAATVFPTLYTNPNIALNTTSTVTYNSNVAQTISGAPAYGNLTLSATAAVTKTLGAPTTVNGNLTINANNTLADGGFQITGNATGTLTMAAGTGLTLGTAASATAFPTLFTSGHSALNATSTVTYNSNLAQTISGIPTYGNVTLASTGAVTKTLGAATTMAGTLTIGANNTLDVSASNFAIGVAGNWTNNGGTFASGSGTVTFTGNAAAINGTAVTQTFNNVIVNKIAGQLLSVAGSTTTLNVNGNFTETTGNFTAPTTMSVTGGVTLTAGTFTAGTTVNDGGNWTNNGATFTNTGSTVVMNGTVAQAIGGTTSTTFNNLTISNTSASVSVNINANTAGTLTVNANAVLSPAAAVIVGGGGTLTGNGTVQVTRTSATADFSSQYTITGKTLTNLTVDYAAAGQVLSNLTYGGLKVSGSITGAGSSATVNGAFTVTGAFTPTTGTMTMNNGSSIVNSGGTLTFADLTIANAATITETGALTVGGTLTVGTGATFTPAGTVTVKGAISNAGSQTGAGSIALSGGVSSHTLSGGGSYTNLQLNDVQGASVSSSTTVNGTLTLTAGVFATGANTLTIASGGSVSLGSGWVNGNMAKTIPTGASTPTFEVGDATNYTPVNLSFAGVTSAGTLTVRTTTPDHPNIATSTINPSLTANRYWTLTNMGIVLGSYSATFTFVAADKDAGADPSQFIVGRYAAATWTYPTVGTKTATSTQATGLAAFGDFQLGQQAIYTSNGTGNWNTPATWTPSGPPTANATVIIAAPNVVTIDVNTANILSLTIQNGATLQGGGAFTLSVGANSGTDFSNSGTFTANTVTVKLSQNSQWAGAGAFNVNNIDFNSNTLTLASGVTVNVSGAGNPLLSPGSLVPGSNSTVIYNGSAAQTISGSANINFNNLQVTNTAGVTLAKNLTAANLTGSLTVTSSGILKTGDGANVYTITGAGGSTALTVGATSTLNIGSSATAAGTFPTGFTTTTLNAAGTVEYSNSSTATQTVSAASTYGNILLSGTGAKSLGGGSINVVGNWTNNSAGAIDATGSTVTFNGSSAQTINGSATTTFNNLTLSNAAGIQLGFATSVNGNLAINNGTLDDKGFQITGNASGTMTMAPSTGLILGSAATGSSFPTNFTALNTTLNISSTVTYSSDVAQTVSGVPAYGNIVFSGSGTKSVNSTTTANGNFTVNSPSVVDVGAITLTIKGSISNGGSLVNNGTILVGP